MSGPIVSPLSIALPLLTPEEQDEIERGVFRDSYSYLYHSISAKDLTPHLFSGRIITDVEMEEVESCNDKFVKNAIVLSVMRRQSLPVKTLCEVLYKVPGQETIATTLLEG